MTFKEINDPRSLSDGTRVRFDDLNERGFMFKNYGDIVSHDFVSGYYNVKLSNGKIVKVADNTVEKVDK